MATRGNECQISQENFTGKYSENFMCKMSQKEYDILLITLVQGFCPLKIKITQFPDGFLLNILTSLQKLGFQMDYETRIYTLTPEINKTNKLLSIKSNNKIFKYLLNNTLCSLPENLTCLKINKYYEKK